MNFPFDAPVTPAKLESLQQRIKMLSIQLSLIEESFVKGSGKGGQKINKTNNAVMLYYPPMNITIKCQRERQRSLNRFVALRELVDQIEMKISPQTSARFHEEQKIRKQKDRRRRRSY